jgi:hypothetical protein
VGIVPAASAWNSLEVAKLLVGVATPLAVVLLGLYVRSAASRIEDAQWANRKVVERKLEVFDAMAPKLNDLYCFFFLVGDFRAITPEDAVRLKRELDREFHLSRFLFGRPFTSAYDSFMAACFVTDEHVASKARPRAGRAAQKAERAPVWDPRWDEVLADPEDVTPLPTVGAAYERLMALFADELGVTGRPA